MSEKIVEMGNKEKHINIDKQKAIKIGVGVGCAVAVAAGVGLVVFARKNPSTVVDVMEKTPEVAGAAVEAVEAAV